MPCPYYLMLPIVGCNYSLPYRGGLGRGPLGPLGPLDLLLFHYHPVLHADGAVGEGCESLVVGDDDEGLAEAVP